MSGAYGLAERPEQAEGETDDVTAPSATPAIALRRLEKRYGAQPALRPVDLEIADGEFFCLLGPSGCGKTTTLNLIGGFVEPTGGEIWIRGSRVDRLPPHRRSVNTVFQSYALFPHMTVSENVAFGLQMAGLPRDQTNRRVRETLELVGLERFGERFPAELSGGQQQRVAVARALVNRPVVLLLDEPLGALDLKLRRRLQLELAQLQREVGTTFVYVTHDQEEAMTMSTRIAVLNDGAIEQIGTPSEIYRRPRSRFVADFIGESNFLDVDVAGHELVFRDGTQLPAPSDAPQRSGRAVLVVRPEWISVGPPAELEHGLHGRVVQTSFLGSMTRIEIELSAAAGRVTAAVFGDGAERVAHLEPGSKVTVRWDPDQAVLLEESAADREEEGEK
jgi:spermidine/putrescine transport system ATP-binding protein